MLSFSEQLIQPYLEGMHRTGTGLLEVRNFLRVKLDDLWLPVQKSSTPVRQRSGRCWHPARAATDCEQNVGNLTQSRHKLQPCVQLPLEARNSHKSSRKCSAEVGYPPFTFTWSTNFAQILVQDAEFHLPKQSPKSFKTLRQTV